MVLRGINFYFLMQIQILMQLWVCSVWIWIDIRRQNFWDNKGFSHMIHMHPSLSFEPIWSFEVLRARWWILPPFNNQFTKKRCHLTSYLSNKKHDISPGDGYGVGICPRINHMKLDKHTNTKNFGQACVSHPLNFPFLFLFSSSGVTKLRPSARI
jgi:hypothetical protein